MIKVVMFDADGVITHREEFFSAKLSREFAIPLEQILVFFNGEFKDCLVGKADLKQVLAPYLKKWNLQMSVDDVLEMWFENENHIDRQVLDYVEELKRQSIHCVLATDNEKYRTKYLKNVMKLEELFEQVFSSCYFGVSKSTPAFYEKVLATMPEVGKDEVLFWDDDVKNVDAAKEFGIQAEVYTTFEAFKEKMKKYIM